MGWFPAWLHPRQDLIKLLQQLRDMSFAAFLSSKLSPSAGWWQQQFLSSKTPQSALQEHQ